VIDLSAAEEAVLRARARAGRSEHRDRQRAAIVLGAAAGKPNAGIGVGLGVCSDTVRKWSRRFTEHRLAGLRDIARNAAAGVQRTGPHRGGRMLPFATGVNRST
jgi:hypothetical protein